MSRWSCCDSVSFLLLYILKCVVVCVGRSGGGGTGTVCHVGAAVTESVFLCVHFEVFCGVCG